MPRLHGLDALRGIAALIVLLGHVEYHYRNDWFVGRYDLAVDFFFMLSGYVMARTYEHRLAANLTPLGFLRIRYKRFFGPAAIGAAIAFLPYLASGHADLLGLVALASAIALVPFYWHGLTYPFNGVRWSLFCEIAANVMHAALFARLPTRWLAALFLVLLCVVGSAAITIGKWPLPRIEDGTFWLGLGRSFVSYILGILIFRLRPALRVPGQVLPLLGAALVGAVMLIGLVPTPAFALAFVLFLCPALLLVGASVNLSDRAAWWASAAGAISYPLYAVHSPILGMAAGAGVAWFVGAAAALLMAALVAFRLSSAPKKREQAAVVR